MGRPRTRTCLLVALLLLLGPSCETGLRYKGEGKDQKVYGVTKGPFRGRWWNYYERALSFADGQFWKEAEADFRKAFAQRTEDRRRARTYGMHFVDYFPHRELGVILFQQGRIEEAAKELEASLKSQKSAKAEYYLDLTRKALILQQNVDARAPEILVTAPEQEVYVNTLSTLVTGVARDDTYVKSLRLNNIPVRIDVAVPSVPFQVEVPLRDGENLIRIAATDLTGRTAQMERKVHVDRQGPTLSIDEPLDAGAGRQTELRLKGYIYDDSGLQEVKVNGKTIAVAAAREYRLDYPVPFSDNLKTVVVEAKDLAGNITQAEIHPGTRATLPPRVLLASLEVPRLAFLQTAKAETDTTPPAVELRDWTEDQTVFLDQAYLEGSARDDGGIESITINGQPILKRPSKTVYFGYLAKLNEGANTFVIEVKDAAGNRTEKQIRIERKVQKVRQLGSRLATALLPLERKGGPGVGGEALEDMLLTGLVERGRFAMVERQRLEAILREQKLSRTDLADQDRAIRVGKIVAANAVLMGSVLEKEQSLEIYARLVDTETSLIVTAVDVYGEGVDLPGLKQLCQGLILKLVDEVPLAEGLVVQVKGDKVFVDLGRESRLKTGMRLTVFEEGEPVRHPVTGAILGADVEQVGHVLVKAVQDQMSQGEVVEKEASGRIKPMQKVITE